MIKDFETKRIYDKIEDKIMDQSFWVPKTESEEHGTMYFHEYLSESKGTCEWKVLRKESKEGYKGTSGEQRCKELGWEIVKVKLKEIEV